jgi:N-acyl-D-aspartate/D-glutamate deacylase
VVGFATACCFSVASFSQGFDVVFRGGDVMDGAGSPAFRADVGVVADRIEAIGDLSAAAADRIVDISGKTIIPGIIDLHSHADERDASAGLRAKEPKRRAAPNLVSQGVTALVANQDGRSPLNILGQRNQLAVRRFGPNAVLMAGHNSLRRAAMGNDAERPATTDEIHVMAALLRTGMEAGAYGLSAGLEYEPGRWSETSELEALVRVVKPYGGVYIVHERASGSDPVWYMPSHDGPGAPTMLDSIMETIAICEATGVISVATHIKARGEDYWGQSRAIVNAIESARARGVKIFADQYPYTTSGSDGVFSLLPRWILDETRHLRLGNEKDFGLALKHILSDPEKNGALRRDVERQVRRRGGAEHIVVFGHPDPGCVGRSLAAIAAANEVAPVEMALRFQFDGYPDRFGGVQLRGFSMSEDDIEYFVAQPWVATASDAGITLPTDGLVHARFYGTFPRKIREYALKRGVLSVEQAVRSMTSLPAEILGMSKRGRVAQGHFADLAVIDLSTIRDTTTFLKPHQYAEGIEYVLVNGVFVTPRNSQERN